MTLHSFSTSRESILPWSSGAQQSSLLNPSTRAADLFVLLQGMLFANIQLDDFTGRLELMAHVTKFDRFCELFLIMPR